MKAGIAVKHAEKYLRDWTIRVLSSLIARHAPPPVPEHLLQARVLLIRQDRIGDVLVSTPFISSLRRRYPSMQLDILVSMNNHMAVDGIPGITKRWIYQKSPLRIISLLRSLRRERYDIAVDLMDNPSATSTLLSLAAGARWTVGIEKENDYVYDVKVPLLSRSRVHIVRRICELLRPFGIDPEQEPLRIVYEPGSAASDEAKRICDAAGLKDGNPICINMSAGSTSREWGTARYASLARLLGAGYPQRSIVVVSSPKDREQALEVASSAPGVVMIPPVPDFQTFAAVIRRMGALVTPDTSVVHLAAAFRVPSVVLFIQTDPELMIWEPYKSPHVSLVSTENSLHPITPEEVLNAMHTIVGKGSVRSGRPVKKR